MLSPQPPAAIVVGVTPVLLVVDVAGALDVDGRLVLVLDVLVVEGHVQQSVVVVMVGHEQHGAVVVVCAAAGGPVSSRNASASAAARSGVRDRMIVVLACPPRFCMRRS